MSAFCFDLAFLDEPLADARLDREALAEAVRRLCWDALAFVEREPDLVEPAVAFVERPVALLERAGAFVEREVALAEPLARPFELALVEPRALALLLRAFDAEFLPDAFSLPV